MVILNNQHLGVQWEDRKANRAHTYLGRKASALLLYRTGCLHVRLVILNKQHLGMVGEWEDRFYKANRAHTYLGRKASALL